MHRKVHLLEVNSSNFLSTWTFTNWVYLHNLHADQEIEHYQHLGSPTCALLKYTIKLFPGAFFQCMLCNVEGRNNVYRLLISEFKRTGRPNTTFPGFLLNLPFFFWLAAVSILLTFSYIQPLVSGYRDVFECVPWSLFLFWLSHESCKDPSSPTRNIKPILALEAQES